ncbi:hypothetical protein [Halomonas caseinilytica]|uniref:hypothetical protein n=1 Tax=Halomonas caseinilytica TaxID=438744 RepID=UPI0007E5A26C|nr:hypothetical protein [Halomonas caseinilytica]SEM97497.1 hypothetical protein SAMN04487952_108206 [Halomonas caseinilytica]
MNMDINLHGVERITLVGVREGRTSDGVYYTATLTIEGRDGETSTLTLFADDPESLAIDYREQQEAA